MPRCQRCGEEIRDELSFTCNYCSETFCKAHRLPEAHDCLGLVRRQATAQDNRTDDNQERRISSGDSATPSEKASSESRRYEPKNEATPGGRAIGTGTLSTLLTRLYNVLKFPFVFPATAASYAFFGALMTLGSLLLIASVGGVGVAVVDEPATDVGEKTTKVLDTLTERARTVDLSSDRPTEAELEAAIHREVNTVRVENGRRSIEHNEELQTVARAHSENMAEEDFFSHENPNGIGPQGRVNRAGLRCSSGENLYYEEGYSTFDAEETAERVISGLMESPGHRENILLPGWVVEGIGVERNGDEFYVTQMFCR